MNLFLWLHAQMDDGKSIRYKDLYALFEHILEKTMRLEQRDWSESPVKVWVNTFKVFLDEFMTEYKPLEGTIGRVRQTRCTRLLDTVERLLGNIKLNLSRFISYKYRHM